MKVFILLLFFWVHSPLFAGEKNCIGKETAIKIMKLELSKDSDLEAHIYTALIDDENIVYYGHLFASSYEDFENWRRYDIEVTCGGAVSYITGSYNGD